MRFRMFEKNSGWFLLFSLSIALVIFFMGCGGGSNGGGGEETPLGGPETGEGPMAEAGPERTGGVAPELVSQPDRVIFLNGGASIGSEFAWMVTGYAADSASGSGAADDGDLTGVKYRLTSPHTAVTGFFADTPGTYTLELTVGDGLGQTDVDTTNVVLEDVRGGSVLVDPNDRDGDGFLNEDDYFPDDRASHNDYDNDGAGNYYQTDVDGDGVVDVEDDYPLDAYRTRYEEYFEASEMPVTGASNQNDGIGDGETAGDAPLRITGYLLAENGGEDVDVYRVYFQQGSHSLVTIADPAAVGLRPSVSVIQADGDFPDQTQIKMAEFNGVSILNVDIPEDGHYFVRVSDPSRTSDPQWKYRMKIFSDDQDHDGVPGDLEKALDSNHLTPDSDGDGIMDFIEIYLFTGDLSALLDMDQDNLPGWWDWDSDEDGLSDGTEYYNGARQFDTGGVESFEYFEIDLDQQQLLALNDADADGRPNFVDLDADGNNITDTIEAGPDYLNPVDTDDDQIPDFLDKDDETDGLLDINEDPAKRTVPLELDDIPPSRSGGDGHTGMLLYYLTNENIEAGNAAHGGDPVTLHGMDLPVSASETWIVLRYPDSDPINLRPDRASNESVDFTWPTDIPAGAVEVFLAFGDRRSNAISVVNSNDTPLLTRITYDPASNLAAFSGFALDSVLELHFTGGSVGFDNSGGSGGQFTATPPAEAKSGMVYVRSENGFSNSLYLTISRQAWGRVNLPDGVSVEMADIEINYSLDPEDEIVTPDASGDFLAEVAVSEPTVVTSILKTSAGEDSDYVPFLSTVVLPGDAGVVLNTDNTALTQVWLALDPGLSLAADSWLTARDILLNLWQVQALGQVMYRLFV